ARQCGEAAALCRRLQPVEQLRGGNDHRRNRACVQTADSDSRTPDRTRRVPVRLVSRVSLVGHGGRVEKPPGLFSVCGASVSVCVSVVSGFSRCLYLWRPALAGPAAGPTRRSVAALPHCTATAAGSRPASASRL